MKKMTMLSILVVFGAATGSQVNATESVLSKLDTDKDGRISVEEASGDAKLAAAFTELDTNQDGYLTPSELANQ